MPGYLSSAASDAIQLPAYSIRHCGGCGLYFKSHTIPLEKLGDYYARLPFTVFDVDYDFPTDRFLHTMLEALPSGATVLDFGCSTGRILKEVTHRLECYGVEINEPAAAIARERGLRIIGEEQVRSGQPCAFDAIVLTDVYEHLSQPVELALALAKALKPGGLLAIVTGNGDAIRDRDRIGEFWYFRLEGHFQMMSEQHVRWLAQHLGLDLHELHRSSHYHTPLPARCRQYLQSFAFAQFHCSPQGSFAPLLRAIPVLKRAEFWPNAPTLNCTADHFTAILRKQ